MKNGSRSGCKPTASKPEQNAHFPEKNENMKMESN